MNKINILIKQLKTNKFSEQEIKQNLSMFMKEPELKIAAQALYSLLFGQVFDQAAKSENQFLLILNAEIPTQNNQFKTENILIYKNKIIGTSQDMPDNIDTSAESIKYINASEYIVSPGLIDQHLHGGYGCNFNTCSVDELIMFCQEITKHGITTIYPTLMTDTKENIKKQLSVISQAKKCVPEKYARIEGIHLEGPLLNTKNKGIHDETMFLLPTIENFLELSNELIKIVSYAPELDKNYELTKYLKKAGIITSAGHTQATYEEIQTAAKYGLKQVTHLFNAMPQLHHRTPGVVGASLTIDSLFTEVIADNNHLHPCIVDLITKSKPKDKIIFISDSLPLNQSDENSMVFGSQEIYKKNDIAANQFGQFAGSLSFLDSIIRKNIKNHQFSDLIRYCSTNPANNLGLQDLGVIAKNKTANLIFWNKDFEVAKVICNGQTL